VTREAPQFSTSSNNNERGEKMAKMKIKERLTVKIDLKDALFGGVAIYVSVFLVTALLVSMADYAFRFFHVIGESGEIVARVGNNAENMYPVLISVMLAIFLVTFLLVVLFDENLFSKHEKGLVNLLGLGLVWGMAFVTIDTLVETVIMYISMFRGWENYYSLTLGSLLFGFPFWIAVAYIIFLPAIIYYLRKNHKEHMEKVKK
jgi:hypothetical protein